MEKISQITVLLILLIVGSFLNNYMKIDNKEAFQTYIQKPYNFIKTGSDPLSFYRRDRYRKPYRYPFKFFKSYPVPHMSHLEE